MESMDMAILGYKMIKGKYCKTVNFGSRKGEHAYSTKEGTEWYYLSDDTPVYCPDCDRQMELCECRKVT